MLEIRDLSKRFGRNRILEGVNASFPSRGMVFVYGDSGSGKTTFLNCVGGLLRHGGTVALDGRPIGPEDVAFVFQGFLLDESESVLWNAVDGLRGSASDFARGLSSLREVGLSLYRRRPASALSTGQKQRLSLARAMTRDPSIVLCDEPTGNLDAGNAALTMGILKGLSAGRLVIVVTHDLSLIGPYADECWLCEAGGLLRRPVPQSLPRKRPALSASAFGRGVSEHLSVLCDRDPDREVTVSLFPRGALCYVSVSGADTVLGEAPAGLEEADAVSPADLAVCAALGPASVPAPKRSRILSSLAERLSGKKGRGLAMLGACSSLVSSALFALAFLSLSGGNVLSVGDYSRSGTVMLTSPESSYIGHDDLVAVLSDDSSMAGEPALIGLNFGLRPVVSWRSFSNCHEPIGEGAESKDAIPCYFLDYGQYAGTPALGSFGGAVGDRECVVDSSLISSLSACSEGPFVGSSFSVFEKSASGISSSEAYSIVGSSDCGFPCVFLSGGRALELDYRNRGGTASSFSEEVSAITFLDYDSMGGRYSVVEDGGPDAEGPVEDNGGSLCYMTSSAASYLGSKDLSFLGLSAVPGHALVDSGSDSSIAIAVRDFPKDGESDGIPSRKRLLQSFAKAASEDSSLLDGSSAHAEEGNRPMKADEMMLSSGWATLIGGFSSARDALSEVGLTLSGVAGGPLGEAYGSGRAEWIDKLVPSAELVTRFHARDGSLRSAPRLLSRDPGSTILFMSSFKGGAYVGEDYSLALSGYARDSSLATAAPYLISCASALLVLFASIAVLSRSEVNSSAYRIGLSRCLGESRGKVFASFLGGESLYCLLVFFLPSALAISSFALSGALAAPLYASLLFPLLVFSLPLLAFAIPLLALLRKEPALLVSDFE